MEAQEVGGSQGHIQRGRDEEEERCARFVAAGLQVLCYGAAASGYMLSPARRRRRARHAQKEQPREGRVL